MNEETLRALAKLEHAKCFEEMHREYVYKFVEESNKIESINRDPSEEELAETHRFLALSKVEVFSLREFVEIFQPGANLRKEEGMNVRIGSHYPPPGGKEVLWKLEAIVQMANQGIHPWNVHQAYETLHPFMDGNGRSGRMLWAWQMVNQQGDSLVLGFLHTWYYQSLEHGR